MTGTTVLHYLTAAGSCPFRLWMASIKDKAVTATVAARINRVRSGTLGDWKAVGEGVFELRIDRGPGYRDGMRWEDGGDPADRRREEDAGSRYQEGEGVLERL